MARVLTMTPDLQTRLDQAALEGGSAKPIYEANALLNQGQAQEVSGVTMGAALTRLVEAQAVKAEKGLQKDQDVDNLRQEIFQARANGLLLSNYGDLISRAAKLGLENYVRQQANEVANNMWQIAVTEDAKTGGVEKQLAFLRTHEPSQVSEIVAPLKLQYERQQKMLMDEAIKSAKKLAVTESDWEAKLKELDSLNGLDFNNEANIQLIRGEVEKQQKLVDELKGGIAQAVEYLEKSVFPPIQTRVAVIIERGGDYTHAMEQIAADVGKGIEQAMNIAGNAVSAEMRKTIKMKGVEFGRKLVDSMYQSKLERQKLEAEANRKEFTERYKWMADLWRFAGNNGPLLLALAGTATGAGFFVGPMFAAMGSAGGIGLSVGIRRGLEQFTGKGQLKDAERASRIYESRKGRARVAELNDQATRQGKILSDGFEAMAVACAVKKLDELGINGKAVLAPYEALKKNIKGMQLELAPVPT
ncbi:hypothetical protein KBD45_01775 [Candidatus Dojkabacteria bacterium]|nr:hypothetical protein [Candidatus Dojkabacteria bacterium]